MADAWAGARADTGPESQSEPRGSRGSAEAAGELLRRALHQGDPEAAQRVARMLGEDQPNAWTALAETQRKPAARPRPRRHDAASHAAAVGSACPSEVSDVVFQKARAGHPDALRLVARWAEADDPDTWRWILDQAELAASAVVRRGTGRRDPELVDELAQSVVLGMHKVIKTGRFDHTRAGHMRGLLRVIATRTLTKFRVSHAREFKARERNASRRAAESRASASAHAQESFALADEVFREFDVDQATVSDAMSKLREPQRTAVVLHARGMTLTQIAEQIGLGSKSGARRVLQTGLRELLDLLESSQRAARARRRKAGT